jgi:hypothetical protein
MKSSNMLFSKEQQVNGCDSLLEFQKGKQVKIPFINRKSFHILFRRFSNFAVSGKTSFFSNSQKLYALIPTLSTLPERLNYMRILITYR